jgi:D-aminoacyl-tRNA deacylase
MKVVIQKVTEAAVTVDNKVVGAIETGLLILVGIEEADTDEDVVWLSHKMVHIRLFNDDQNVMNKSIIDIDGNILLISQFTLQASTKKGNRPSYIKAAKPEVAIPMYKKMIAQLEKNLTKTIATGVFGADMKVNLINDGPVTIVIDSKNRE